MNLHKTIPKILMIASWLTMTSMAYAAKYTYDDLNRIIQVAYDSGQIVSYRYDAGGNMLMVENEMPISLELTLTPAEVTAASISNGGSRNPTTIAWKATGSSKCSASFEQKQNWMFVDYTSDKACDGKIFLTSTRLVSNGTYEGTVKVCADGTNYCDTKSFIVKVDSSSLDTDGDGINDEVDTDDDNDGLPDTYENQYAFLNPLDPSDASVDEDDDGKTNLEEYRQGTNPTVVDHQDNNAPLFIDSGQSFGNSRGFDVALGDVDGDNDLDAFVPNLAGANKVWLNDGSGNFSDSGQSLGTLMSYGVSLGDVDGDGDIDAFVTNFDQPNKVWLNDGAGNFSDSEQSLGNSKSSAVGLGDIDGDGDIDAVVVNRQNQADKVWVNDGYGNFSDSGQSLGNSSGEDIALGDVDNDGDIDIFVANIGQPNQVWLNDGAGNFRDNGQSLGQFDSDRATHVALGDIDADNDLDAFVTHWGKTNKVWIGDGKGNFSASGYSISRSNSSYGVSLGDLDGDGDTDAFVGVYGGNTLWLNNGIGVFKFGGLFRHDSYSDSVALGDLDDDGDLDAFVTNSQSRGNKIWLNQSSLVDTDGDGIDDNTDTDDDGDGVADAKDAFPLDAKESVDTDGDGTGNNADTDDDGDGLPDEYEGKYPFLNPLDSSDASADEDEDGKSNLEEYLQGTEPNVSENTATVRLVMSASPSPVRVGEDFEVTFRILQDGQKVDAQHLGVLFDNQKLHANSVTNSGKLDFVLISDINNAEGFVTFAVGNFMNTLPTGDFALFAINFTAKEATDSTVLRYDPIQQCRGTYESQYIQQTCEPMTLVIKEPTLACKVDLQGRQPAPDASWVTPLRLSGAITAEVTTDDSGSCEFDALPDGDHTICFKGPNDLQNKANVSLPLADDNAVIDVGLLLEGDVNDDNAIEVTDFSALLNNKGKCQADAGFNANADLNVDGCVDLNDAKLLRANYLKVGQQCGSTRSRYLTRRAARDGKTTSANTTALRTSPIPVGIEAGSTFEFDIEVYTEAGVDAAAVYLNFPTDKLQVNYLKAGDRFDFVLQNEFDNIAGYINFAAGVWENPLPTGVVTLVTVNATALESGAERRFSFNSEFPRTTKATFGGEAVLDTSDKDEEGDDDEKDTGEVEVVFAMIPQFFTLANTPVAINLSTEQTVTATDGSNGTVIVKRDNSIVYTPNPDFTGTDSFAYTIGDEDRTHTMSVTVDPKDMDSVCYAVADNDGREGSADMLVTMDKFTSEIALVGETDTQHIEAIAFNLGATTLYAADEGQLGQLNLTTGTFTPTAQPFGQGNGALGLIAFDDVDGLTYDVINGILYGTQRLREGQHDVLFQSDPSTGASIPNAFGEGIDYVVVNGPELADLSDIDDIALDNTSGVLYGAANTDGKGGLLVTIDTLTGKAKAVGEFGVDNIEGLAFFNNGQLFGTTGTGQGAGNTDNRLYQIDKYTGITASLRAPFSEYRDYESVGCLTDDLMVFIDGERLYVGRLDREFSWVESGPVGISIVDSPVPGLWKAVMVSKDEQGRLRQQNLSPIPVDAEVLQAFFEDKLGAESVRLAEETITVEIAGQTYEGQLSYDRQVTDQSTDSGEVQILSIPDANGDGLDDFVIIYPNGQRQTLYFLGVQ